MIYRISLISNFDFDAFGVYDQIGVCRFWIWIFFGDLEFAKKSQTPNFCVWSFFGDLGGDFGENFIIKV